jgi:hypothetical protein
MYSGMVFTFNLYLMKAFTNFLNIYMILSPVRLGPLVRTVSKKIYYDFHGLIRDVQEINQIEIYVLFKTYISQDK